MKQVYIRRAPSTGETTSAAVLAIGLAAVVGAATFYLTRTLLARDEIPASPQIESGGGVGELEGPE